MEKIRCGQQGLLVSRLGLGCMGMSQSYGPASKEQALNTLYKALELGVTFWDTADIYGQGSNEALLCPVLSQNRERIQLASKCGILGYGDDGVIVNGRPDYIKKCCKASLKRLGVEHIDLFYLHRVDPKVPIEESIGGLGELVDAGLVRYIGISEANAKTIRRAHKEFPLSALQSEYSLFSRAVEKEVLPTLRELGISLVAYSPLGRGLLTGSITGATRFDSSDRRSTLPRFSKENLENNLALVAEIEAIARSHGFSAAQLALGWIYAQGEDIICIPGTKRLSYLADNVEALQLAISPQSMSRLDTISSRVAGERYPKKQMAAVAR